MTDRCPEDGVCDQCGEGWSSFWRHIPPHEWQHKCDNVHPQAGHVGRLITRDHWETKRELEAARAEIARLKDENVAFYEALTEITDAWQARDDLGFMNCGGKWRALNLADSVLHRVQQQKEE